MSANDPNLIQISLAALAKMVKFDLSMKGKETVGLLIGHEDDGIVYVEDVRLGEQTGNAVHVEINEEELTQATIEISQRHDNKVIVGWIHTHPGLSAFLSGTDINTQKLYQAFMPNAIAIVVDPEKYSKTMDLDDLDIKVFRVIDDKAKEYRYTITNTVEFGLNTFISGDTEVEVHSSAPTTTTYQIPVPNATKINELRLKLDETSDNMPEEDIKALNYWLDLVEAMESGDIMEVPVEVDVLISQLDNSISLVDDNINHLRRELEYRKDERTLFALFIGLFLEFSAFYFLIPLLL